MLLDQIATDHPGIDTLVLDVTDPGSIARAAETVAVSHPELNVLINNAGIMLRENLRDPDSLPVAEDTVTTNLLGTIRTTYAFLPQLVTKDDAVVMNVTSGLAFVPLPITPTYNATKDFLSETMTLLRTQPVAREIIVERAKFVRYDEANGRYDDALAILSGR